MDINIEMEFDDELFPEEFEGIPRSYYYDNVKVTRFDFDDIPIKAGVSGFITDDDERAVAMIENDKIKGMIDDYLGRGDIVKVAFDGDESVAIAFYKK